MFELDGNDFSDLNSFYYAIGTQLVENNDSTTKSISQLRHLIAETLANIEMTKKGKTYNLKVASPVTGKTVKCQLATSSRLHPDNGNVVWDATFSFNDEETFSFNDEEIKIEGEYLLSGIIDKIREAIEPQGYRILVKSADLDASHSGMQRDMSAGTLIYKLKILDEINSRPESERNTRDAEFHVLDESDLESVATLQQQKVFRNNYLTQRRLKK